MSLDTETAPASEAAPASESPAPESTSAYSVTDPGYEADISSESAGDELAALKAENETPKNPPDEQSGDAGSNTEETAETPADEAADPTGISDELLDRALELGYTVDELKAFRSEKSLAKEVARVEKIQKRFQERQAGKPPAEESAPAEEASPEPEWDKLIELGHDPDMIALQKQNWQRAQNAEAMVQRLLQTEQDRALTAQSERFDETLNKLEGFDKLLGSGRRGELLQASPEHVANRQKVFTKMLVLKRGYEEAGEKVPAETDLIQEAVQASFYKHAQETARQKLKGEIKKAGSQALSRPRSAGAKPMSGPSLALAKEAEFWKKVQ